MPTCGGERGALMWGTRCPVIFSSFYLGTRICSFYNNTSRCTYMTCVLLYMCVNWWDLFIKTHKLSPPPKKTVTSCAWLCLHKILFQNHPERESGWEEAGAGALLMNWLPLEFTLIDANWILIETIYPGPKWTWKKLQYLEATPQRVCKHLSHCTILPSTLFVY